jgi:DNA polymerase elongation subunit (family B)
MKFYTSAHKKGRRILVKGVDQKGNPVRAEIPYQPSLYRRTGSDATHVDIMVGKDGMSREHRVRYQVLPTKMKTLDGVPVDRLVFKDMIDGYAYWKYWRGFSERCSEFTNDQAYGIELFEYAWINEVWPDSVVFDVDQIVVANIDIEVDNEGGNPNLEEADREITLITMKVGPRIHTFGTMPFNEANIELPRGTTLEYHRLPDEKELLRAFVRTWRKFFPDVVTGWNVERFDWPYLIKRMILNGLRSEDLSVHAEIRSHRFTDQASGKSEVDFPLGVTVLDYLQLYRNRKLHPKARESYTLDYIAHVEVGERKLTYSEFETLAALRSGDPQKYVEYNIRDVLLVDKIDQKMRLLERVFALAYYAKCNYEDVLGSIKQWEIIIHSHLMKRGVVLPPKRRVAKPWLLGGYVKEPRVGSYEWVLSVDFDSLYSHIQMLLNISPETFISRLPGYDPFEESDDHEAIIDRFFDQNHDSDSCVAPNGCTYDKGRRGFIPQLLEEMYARRVEYKDRAIDAKRRREGETNPAKRIELEKEAAAYGHAEQSLKINLNSVYGCLTNPYFRFFSHENAEAITSTGQAATRWVARAVNQWMNEKLTTKGIDYIIAADTDSLYINLGPVISSIDGLKTKQQTCDFIDHVFNTALAGVIERACSDFATHCNAIAPKLRMKRESIANRAVWLGAKNYILHSLDKEGVRFNEPEIEMKGIAAVKSSTPSSCRDKIKEVIRLVMEGRESRVQEFIDTFRAQFMALSFEEIASPRSVSALRKYQDERAIFGKGTPIQVKGALIYNKLILDKGLANLTPILDRDKVRYAYLKSPNPLGKEANVIAVPSGLPPELGLDEYVDREKQFAKGFMDPLTAILDAARNRAIPTAALRAPEKPRARVRHEQDSGKRILIVLTDAALHMRDGRPSSVAGEEACGCYLALERQGHEPWLLVDRKSTPGSYRVTYDDVDVNQFDEMMLNREGPNFIGGTVHERHLWTARAVCQFKERISYFFADPEMRKGEYLAAFLNDVYVRNGKKNYQGRPIDKKGLNELIPQAMLEDNLHKTSKDRALVRSGYPCVPDHAIHKKRGFGEEIQFIDSWRMGLFHIREPWDPLFDEPHERSACYIGNFKPHRRRRLEQLELLTPAAEDEGLVKYYGKMARVIAEARGEKVKRLGGAREAIDLNSVSETYARHVASLVIGHPDQRNTGLSHRFLQSFLVRRSILADHYQDEHRHWVLDPDLREVLFFSDALDYREKLDFIRNENNFDWIVKKLAREAERINNEPVDDLLRRVRGR